MTKTVLLASAAALALTIGGASAGALKPGASSLGSGHFAKNGVFPATPGSVTLYDQNSNDSGIGIVSDDFDSGSFDIYDDQGADDFTVPAGAKWAVKSVNVTGVYFNGPGPADGVNVYFYKDAKGLPGDLITEIDSAKFKDNGTGSFSISLGSAGPKLKGGKKGKTYWVSVQAQMNFSSGAGEWGWENQTTSEGHAAAWQNPGGGFSSTGCTSWQVENVCIPDGQGDHMFTLKGKAS